MADGIVDEPGAQVGSSVGTKSIQDCIQALEEQRDALYLPVAIIGLAADTIDPNKNWNLAHALEAVHEQLDGMTSGLDNVLMDLRGMLGKPEVQHG